jgi:hypothetical protein
MQREREMNGTNFRRNALRLPLTARRLAITACLVGVVGGCGGGGADQVTGNTGDDTSTVAVSVKDALDSPVAGALVTLTRQKISRDGVTDETGAAVFRSVPEGELSVYARYEAASMVQFGSQSVVVGSGRSDVEVAVRPWPGSLLGVAPATRVSVALDGRSMEFALRLRYQLGSRLASAGPYHMAVTACAPDAADDVPVVQADCVRGADGFDAPYEVVDFDEPVPAADRSESETTSSAVLLAIDQSTTMSDRDPLDQRLYAAKFFLKSKLPSTRVALAAFASDDGVSGVVSPLPRKPVTVFPVDLPAFTTSSVGLLPIVDSLDRLEGGRSPTYGAMSALLDFAAAQTSAAEQKTLVVLSASPDDTCGSVSECGNARNAVIEKSRNLGVALVMVHLKSESESIPNEELAELAEGRGGSAFWVGTAGGELAGLFGALGDVIDEPQDVLEARFRIQSSAAGVFQSGRTVLGTVQLEDCTYGCWDAGSVPFAVRIP